MSGCADIARGPKGDQGISSFVYIAYASDADGTNFSLIPSALLPYISLVVKQNPTPVLGVTEFPKPFFRYLGEQGEFGGNSDLFIFSTALSGNPASGKLLLNNANITAATALHISDTDAATINVVNWILGVNISTATNKASIRIAKKSDSTAFALYTVTALSNPGGYSILTVTYLASSSNSPFAAGDELIFSYGISGDNGAPGIDARSTLINDLAQTASSDTSGSIVQFKTETIPANTLIADGDQVVIQAVGYDNAAGASPTPQFLVGMFGGYYGGANFYDVGWGITIDITIDRISSTQVLVNFVTASRGIIETRSNIVTVDPLLAITVNLFAQTTTGTVILRKFFAEYKPN